MAASTFGAVGAIAILLVVLGVINPMLIPLILVLAALPLVLRGVLGLFRHAPTSGTPARDGGPRVPSTREASYDPVERP